MLKYSDITKKEKIVVVLLHLCSKLFNRELKVEITNWC